jgi:quinol monooxygenase YgiN
MYLVVQHTVRDYDSWKPVFDEHESVRAKYGAQGHTIYRDVEKPNDLTIFNRFESRARAEEFARDPSLAEAMQRGGVISEPRIMWVEEADSVSYAGRRAA